MTQQALMSWSLRGLCVSSILLWGTLSLAFDLPKNLTHQDRKKVLRSVGLPAGTKLLSTPYPLGGFDGLEASASLDTISSLDFKNLGDKSVQRDQISYPRLHLGKGLFSDVDLFMHFTPYHQALRTSEFGALFRWTFLKPKYLPITLSLVGHANIMNLSDSLINETIGGSVVVGLYLQHFSIYLGGGPIKTKGTFMSGNGPQSVVNPSDSRVNGDTNKVSEAVRSFQSFVGMTFYWQEYFLAVEANRYEATALSAKLGLRY